MQNGIGMERTRRSARWSQGPDRGLVTASEPVDLK